MLEVLQGMPEVKEVRVECGGALLARDRLCAEVTTNTGARIRFERVGFGAFGPNATHIVVAEAGGLVPRIASCDGVGAPDFHRSAPLGHHFGPTLIDVPEAITRAREVLEEVEFWPACPTFWEVQDTRGANYRYCSRRADATAEPPAPEGCPR